MSRVKSTNRITIYERGNAELEIGKSQELVIESHWNRGEWAVITIPGAGKNITVAIDDLEDALRKARNLR